MNTGASDLPLRDIHLPDPVSWWPPAPGWWLLPVCVLLLGLGVRWLRQRYRRGALAREAQAALASIAADYRAGGDALRLAQSLSVLLRRIALSRNPRADVAGLAGESWLAWLDRAMSGHEFRQGAGRALIEAPYRPAAQIDGEALLALCERWIRHAAPDRVRRA